LFIGGDRWSCQLDPRPVGVDVLDFFLRGIAGSSASPGAHGTTDDGARRASHGSTDDRAADGASGTTGACTDFLVVALSGLTGDGATGATDGGTGQRTWRSPDGATDDSASGGASGTTGYLTADVQTFVPIGVARVAITLVLPLLGHVVFLPTVARGSAPVHGIGTAIEIAVGHTGDRLMLAGRNGLRHGAREADLAIT
jgi:hypothetical protein